MLVTRCEPTGADQHERCVCARERLLELLDEVDSGDLIRLRPHTTARECIGDQGACGVPVAFGQAPRFAALAVTFGRSVPTEFSPPIACGGLGSA